MGSDAEPAKLLLPYLQRADELQKHEPLVAYYCRLYAMERGLQIPQKERTKTTNDILISLMKQLEKDKKTLKLAPDDNMYLEGFATNVFAKADKQDRAGRADLNTAKTFYAASIFFEILNQFGELPPDLEQKQRYAVWKAADIRKAMKEGRKPEPGPPGSDKDETNPSLSPSNSHDLGRSQSFSTRQQSIDPPTQPIDKPSPSKDLGRRESFSSSYSPPVDPTPPHHHTDKTTQHLSTNSQFIRPPSDYSPSNENNFNLPQFPPATQFTDRPDLSSYSQQYPHPQNYYPSDNPNPNPNPSFSYPNFQSYPSFQDSTLPSVPAHQPSFNYSQVATVSQTIPVVPTVPVAESYQYDSSYQPSVEKISEAHKSARFAVGALAFDDVAVAVDHLKRALDLLTNPSAETR